MSLFLLLLVVSHSTILRRGYSGLIVLNNKSCALPFLIICLLGEALPLRGLVKLSNVAFCLIANILLHRVTWVTRAPSGRWWLQEDVVVLAFLAQLQDLTTHWVNHWSCRLPLVPFSALLQCEDGRSSPCLDSGSHIGSLLARPICTQWSQRLLDFPNGANVLRTSIPQTPLPWQHWLF